MLLQLEPLAEVEHQTLAQGTLGRLDALDAEQRHQGVKNAEPTRHHVAAVVLQARQLQAVDVAGAQTGLDAPAQLGGAEAAVAAQAGGLDHLGHGAHRAAGAQHLTPVGLAAPLAEQHQRLLQLGGGQHLGFTEGRLGQLARGKAAHRKADAADGKTLGAQRLQALPEDHLGAAPADVDDEPGFVRGLQVRDAGVDQARLLAPGDDLDGMTQRLAAAHQEGVAVARLAQGLRGHGAHALR